MEIWDEDTLSNEDYEEKKRKEKLDFLAKIPKYTKKDMIEFARCYYQEADQFPPVSMDSIFNDWEQESQ